MLTLTIILSSLVQFIVSFFILKKGRQNVSYVLFFVLSLVTWAWALLNYVSVVIGDSALLTPVVRTIMLLAVVQIGLFYLFAHAFPQSRMEYHRSDLLSFVIVTLLVMIVAASPFLFKSVAVTNGVIHPNVGFGILVFIAYALFCIGGTMRIILHKMRTSIGLKRYQLTLILLVAILNLIVVPFTNFVLTLAMRSLIFVKIAPLYTLLFASIIAYALVNRRLFDARTNLRDTTIYIDQYLRSDRDRTYEYYELQTLIYKAGSNHIALDFSRVKSIDAEAVRLVKALRAYMKEQGKTVYFTGYSQPIFNQLRPNDEGV